MNTVTVIDLEGVKEVFFDVDVVVEESFNEFSYVAIHFNTPGEVTLIRTSRVARIDVRVK